MASSASLLPGRADGRPRGLRLDPAQAPRLEGRQEIVGLRSLGLEPKR